MTEPKPCPWCSERRVIASDFALHVFCPTCHASGPLDYPEGHSVGGLLASIIRLWNTREAIEEGKANMTEPKPCPFCRSTNLRCEQASTDSAVTCNQCGAWGPSVRTRGLDAGEALAAIVDAWNVRAKGGER